MYHDHTLIARPPGLVPHHLGLLAQALDRLTDETRQAVARTIARVAAGLVCEAVSAALAAPDPHPQHESWGRQERGRPFRGPCDRPQSRYSPSLLDDPADGWEDEDLLFEPHYPQPPERPPEVSWSVAAALGLRLSAWWLCRHPGPPPVASTLALGVGTAMAALAGGPLAVAGLEVVGALLGLQDLTHASDASACLTGPRND